MAGGGLQPPELGSEGMSVLQGAQTLLPVEGAKSFCSATCLVTP